MFRPFLPCGIAYGFAYALPMAFHALFPAEGIPPGCLYCTISARCLSTGFGRISAAFAFFRRRGVPPCRGGLLRRCRRGGRWRRPTGGVLSLSPAYPAFSLLYRPLSPQPALAERSSPGGMGETKILFRGGLRPRHPCTEPLAALARPANPAPAGDLFSASPVRCKTDRTAFLLAVPAAKERGDRGRGTSAFEMVLSPGAGRTSAAGVQPPPGGANARRAGNAGGKPPAGTAAAG